MVMTPMRDRFRESPAGHAIVDDISVGARHGEGRPV
jgi:hypothetical protein